MKRSSSNATSTLPIFFLKKSNAYLSIGSVNDWMKVRAESTSSIILSIRIVMLNPSLSSMPER